MKRMTPVPTLRASWKQIEKHLRALPQADIILQSLNRPASTRDIARAEAKLGMPFPADLRGLFGLFNGQRESKRTSMDEVPEVGLIPSYDSVNSMPFLLRSLSQMARASPRSLRGAADGWKVGWLPFATNGGGDEMVIDLTSLRGPRRGRVLQFSFEYGGAVPIADSIASLFHELANGLTSKRVQWRKSDGVYALVRRRGMDFDKLSLEEKLERGATRSEKRPTIVVLPPAPRVSAEERQREEDRRFLDALGAERTDVVCRSAGCTRGAVKMSAFCRRHHFLMIKSREPGE